MAHVRLAAAFGFFACFLSRMPAQDPAPYFPLEEGNSWSYIGEGRLTNGATFDIRVDRVEGDLFVIQIDPIPLCFEPHDAEYKLLQEGDSIDIDIPDTGLQPYYRFGERSFRHFDLCTCDNDRVLTAAAEEEVTTQAGTFTCIRLDYEIPGTCFDAGKGSEWWARGVGLVQWNEQTFAGPGTFKLASYSVGGVEVHPFLRANSNQDDTIDISDAVNTLGFLFLGGAAPECLDAADADDNGELEITDPVFTLTFLFGGGKGPPFPNEECGADPTADELSCAAYGACGPAEPPR